MILQAVLPMLYRTGGESITLSDKFPQLEKLGDADFSEVISSYRAVLGSLQKELDEQS